MDHHRQDRRLRPDAEGMERREALSATGAPDWSLPNQGLPAERAPKPAPARAAADAPPANANQQLLRIERLPFFLQQYAPGRVLPSEVVQQLQADLEELQNTLTRRPPSAALGQFNERLRETLTRWNTTADNVVGLSASFGKVLLDAGAAPDLTRRLQQDMRDLVANNYSLYHSAPITANDYGTVMQVALGVGRPAPAPASAPKGA